MILISILLHVMLILALVAFIPAVAVGIFFSLVELHDEYMIWLKIKAKRRFTTVLMVVALFHSLVVVREGMKRRKLTPFLATNPF